MRHHEDTVAAFTQLRAQRPETLGVVVVGSVARGEERSDSDVDVYVVVTDTAYEAAAAADAVAMVSAEGVAYEGGYVDIKLASPTYLARAVVAADDPTRASMLGGRVTLDRIGGLAELVREITVLPDGVWPERATAYRAQFELYADYFLGQAADRGDDFLLRHSALHACLAAGRLALAQHRRLFRGQKYLARDLGDLPELPSGFLEAWRRLLSEATPAAARDVRDIVDGWLFGQDPRSRPSLDEMLSRFIADNELGWLTGRRPPEFW